MSKLVGFGKFAALPEEQISERSTQHGFDRSCDSRRQRNGFRCRELRLVECGGKLESFLVYSFDWSG